MGAPEKGTVEVIEKSLKERDNEEKERLNKRRVINLYLNYLNQRSLNQKTKEDIEKFIGLYISIIKITFDHSMITQTMTITLTER